MNVLDYNEKLNSKDIDALIAKHIGDSSLPVKFLEEHSTDYASNTDEALKLLKAQNCFFEITPASKGYLVVLENNGGSGTAEHRMLSKAICIALLRSYGVRL